MVIAAKGFVERAVLYKNLIRPLLFLGDPEKTLNRAIDMLRDADRVKVGHAQITRTESPAGIVDDELVELRLGKTGRRVRYRIHLVTESAPDGTLRRMLRDVQASEGNSRIDARVAGEDLEITRGVGEAANTERIAGAGRELRSEEFARAWLAAAGGAGGVEAGGGDGEGGEGGGLEEVVVALGGVDKEVHGLIGP